jgi:anti-sigma factor RsiW
MSGLHLTDAQIQGLADGTLRGPEGLAARDHCDECSQCGGELALYSALTTRLSALHDPLPPTDFTAMVLAQVSVREAHRAARRQTLLAAIPAVALAMVAIIGWGLSATLHVDRVLESFTLLRTVFGVLGPVFAATRVYLGVGAFVFLAVVLTALSRTLRPLQVRAVKA